jgi:hypothetical protein
MVVKMDPPLLWVAAMRMAKRAGLHLVNWLHDLYPEVAVGLGVLLNVRLLERFSNSAIPRCVWPRPMW